MLAERFKVWWLNRLDNDSVRAWVSPFCTIWALWAFCAWFFLPPVSTISEAMGITAYYAWVIIAIPANLMPIIGLKMRHGGSAVSDMSNKLLFRDWMGLIFQATGHAVCFILMIMFEVSAWVAVISYNGSSSYAGVTMFAASMLLPWTGGSALLCAQCVRKIERGRHLGVIT